MPIQATRKHKKVKPKKILTSLLSFIVPAGIIALLLIDPRRYSAASFQGLMVWATAVLPGLLPFMVFSRLLSGSGVVGFLSRKLEKPARALYRVPGTSAYIAALSFLAGYPLGAKLIADSYSRGGLTAEEAARTASFTAVTGPIFILGTLGGFFKNPLIAPVVLISHLLGALINGFIYRGRNKKKINATISPAAAAVPLPAAPPKNQKGFAALFTESVFDSAISVLAVGGYIALFFFLSEIAADLKLFYPLEALFGATNPGLGTALGKGILEMTAGCAALASAPLSDFALTLSACFIVSFGGLSVMAQGLSFLIGCKIKPARLFLIKLTHSVISVLICLIISLLVFNVVL